MSLPTTSLACERQDPVGLKVEECNEDAIEHHIPSGHGSGESVFSLEGTLMGVLADKLHNAASLLAIPMMIVFICVEVVMRYVFNAGLFWSQEACCIGMFVLVLCCQANCWQKDRHIRMDLIYNFAPAWFRRLADTLSIISGTVFFGVIGLQAIKDIPYQVAVNEATDELHIPMWLLSGIVIISCSLLVGSLFRYMFKMTSNHKGDA